MSSDHDASADHLVSISEAAKQLGLNKSTLSRQVKAGQVRSHQGKVRISEVRADRASNVKSDSKQSGKSQDAADATHATPKAVASRPVQRNDATPAVASVPRATPLKSDEVDGLISIGEAARRLGINKSTLSRQVKSGAIRSHGGQVRYSEVLEDRAKNINLTKAKATKGRRGETTAPPEAADVGEADELPPQIEMIEVDGVLLPFNEAARLKENYLARLRKLEFEIKSRVVVDRAAAERAFFEVAREIRDAWLGWPARVATLLAADLGLQDRQVAETLMRYVEQHLKELGEHTAPDVIRQH